MLNPSWFVGYLLQVISAEDKSIQGGLYRFQGNFLLHILPIVYTVRYSGRTNTLCYVSSRPHRGKEGKGRERERERKGYTQQAGI